MATRRLSTRNGRVTYKTMTPLEFVRAQARLDLSGVDFATMIGVGWRQAQRYRDGRAPIPDPVAKLIRTALKHGLTPEEIA